MRETHRIGRKAGASLLHSVRTAETIGQPLNTFVTINFWAFGVTAETIFHEFADMRGDWFQRWSNYNPRDARLPKNGSPTYAYVHEAGNNQPHTHWLVHVKPANRKRFAQAIEKWLKKRFRLPALPEGSVHIQDAQNPEGVKLYMAKTLADKFADRWGIWTVTDGVIMHRRADTSRNIGPAVWGPLKAIYKGRRMAA